MVWGHPPEALWSYTPKQAAAWAVLGFARDRAEKSEQLKIAAMAARGKEDSLKATLKEWDQ